VFWPKGTAAAQAIQPVSLHAARADEISYTAPLWPCSPQADARTDIFAFGAVIYEMATGRKAFEAKLVAAGMVSGFLHPSTSTVEWEGALVSPLVHVIGAAESVAA
jgi:serine/threonine protein kinase